MTALTETTLGDDVVTAWTVDGVITDLSVTHTSLGTFGGGMFFCLEGMELVQTLELFGDDSVKAGP